MGEGIVYTIGHSTRTASEFLALLHGAGVQCLIDVRRFPGSRRHPQFGRDELTEALASVGIEYRHSADLGGRRSALPDSPNTAWRNAGFRGYADYQGGKSFGDALSMVIDVAREKVTCLMCAEAVYWRCHRQLIADRLVAAGWTVVHILGPDSTREHVLNPDAIVQPSGIIVYESASSGEQPDLFGNRNDR